MIYAPLSICWTSSRMLSADHMVTPPERTAFGKRPERTPDHRNVEGFVSQAGQGGARGVREPAGRLDHVVESRSGLALHKSDDLRPLRPAATLPVLGLRLALLGDLL